MIYFLSTILSRLWVGTTIVNGVKTLNGRQIILSGYTSNEKPSQLFDYLMQLPSKIVCLLPTGAQCQEINNNCSLNRIPTNVVEIISIDDIKSGGKYQKHRVL